jgi:drug/metabolite transporter (DMT)-like permease
MGAGLVATAFVVLWCTGYPAAKIALGHTGPFVLLTLRFGGAALVCGALALQARAPWPRGRQALHSVAIGTLQLALQFGGVYLAAARGVSVGLIALVIGTMPIVTALIGLVFGERILPLQWLGFVFGFGGVALAVGESIRPGAAADWVAYLAMILGLIGIASGTVYQKRCGSQMDLRSGLALQHAVAALLLLPGAVLEGWRWDGSAPAFVTLGWLIVVNSLGGFALFYLLLKRGAVNQVAALFFLMPPVTAVLDYLVLGEPLSGYQLAGIALAAFGVFLATRPHDGGSALRPQRAASGSSPLRPSARRMKKRRNS